MQGALRERVQHPVEHGPIFLPSHRFLYFLIKGFGFGHFDNMNVLMDNWEFVFEPCVSLLEAQEKNHERGCFSFPSFPFTPVKCFFDCTNKQNKLVKRRNVPHMFTDTVHLLFFSVCRYVIPGNFRRGSPATKDAVIA